MDDDLQHPPEEIPKLLEKLAGDCEVVYGTPDREQHGLWRDIASRVTKASMAKVMNVDMAHRASAFRAFRSDIRKSFENFHGPFVSVDVLLAWGTSSFSSVEVRHQSRPSGVSGYTFGKLVAHALNMMTGFSSFPLRVATFLGFVLTVFGAGILAYVVGRFLFQGSVVRGFPFLASIIAIFSGTQLFALGIIGEYLGHVHSRSMARPMYIVRESTAPSEEK
jgi:undecaprenyl-phosphate 4-deoxy-4-formamido-L-arabinose transferase